MNDAECVRFLQWALPQNHMRWPGFRKVRAQVCKRIAKRLAALQLADVVAYQDYFTRHSEEWPMFDELCRVTITRFYRDKLVFSRLSETILPALATQARVKKYNTIRLWSIGCSSGEEPYTLAIIWRHLLAQQFADIHCKILASEADARLLERSQQACYPASAIKNLPDTLRDAAFYRSAEEYCLKPDIKEMVEFTRQDIRTNLPAGRFDLILCRNLVFTYFDEPTQQSILCRLYEHLHPEGWLVLGVHEHLPDTQGFNVVSQRLGLYQKICSMPDASQ